MGKFLQDGTEFVAFLFVCLIPGEVTELLRPGSYDAALTIPPQPFWGWKHSPHFRRFPPKPVY